MTGTTGATGAVGVALGVGVGSGSSATALDVSDATRLSSTTLTSDRLVRRAAGVGRGMRGSRLQWGSAGREGSRPSASVDAREIDL
jgi:hypothetical protein